MADVGLIVGKAAKMGQPALALTDHGNMAGVVALYKGCKAHGILPFPGFEGYLIDPTFEGDLADSGKANRYHFGMLALTERGYKGLVSFISKAHTRPRFNRFPRHTLSDLASFGQEYGDDVALTTGCYFGLVQQTAVTDGFKEAQRIVKMLAQWFPHTYVEVQHHNIAHENELDDDRMVKGLVAISDSLGLPVIATQDSHYLLRKHKAAHALMKRMVYGGVEDEFPGDSFHLASADWVAEHYTQKQWNRFEAGYSDLLDLNKVCIKPLDRFKVDVPGKWKNPTERLEQKVVKAHKAHMAKVKPNKAKRRKYEDRMAEELSVINDLKMPAYFLLWERFVQWCRRQRICIEARGSANGSYVCFLLGITQIDPIYDGTHFPRFLSRDRIKPPDIDMDIEDGRRGDAILWLAQNWDSVQIGTWSQLGISINPKTGEERGSVFTTWQQGKRRECEAKAWEREQKSPTGTRGQPHKGNAIEKGKKDYARRFGWMKSIEDVRDHNLDDYIGLVQISEMKSVYRSYGKHAGGVLLSGNKVKIADYIPTMLVASSNSTVTMSDMDAVEEFGLLKNDLLGQTSLSVLRICQELIGKPDPTDFTWIPRDDPETIRALRNSQVDNGIFHFEGYTKSKGARELGVKNVRDAILVHALYMPGCMDVAPGQSISQKDLYLQRRRNPALRKKVKYLHPAFEKALSPTYGCVVYQEQVIDIMRDLGMSMASVNKFFKVVKDSGKGAVERNKGRMQEVRQEFDDICRKNEIDPDEAWAQTASFVAYGFNKNHATGYGLRSYRCAYLKTYYPLEFMTALLQSWAGDDKEKVYLREVRKMGIRILPPDINNPSSTWSMDKRKRAVRRGLVSLTGIGPSVAEELSKHAPYKDMDDFAARVDARRITGVKDWREGRREQLKGVLKILDEANVLEALQ